VLALRAIFFAFLLPGTVIGWVPMALLRRSDWLELGAARFVGLPLIGVGSVGLLWCIWDFARVGRGTLAPVDPPRFLVKGGLYRYVRNPMYVSVLFVVLGEALLFESRRLFVWFAAVAAAFHLFVLLYEEPNLTDRCGESYLEYKRSVPRWLPKMTPR
jgi:protein-S-isoprenylcysteine O-methyltransferase Ste14